MAAHRSSGLVSARARFWFAVFIFAVWGISFFVDILVKDYDPPASVHAVTILVVGSVFSSAAASAIRNGNGNGNGG